MFAFCVLAGGLGRGAATHARDALDAVADGKAGVLGVGRRSPRTAWMIHT
jgi:hypothetical protein